MIDIINQRYDEINRGVRNSEINLGKAKERAKQDEDPRITAMMEQMAALQAQPVSYTHLDVYKRQVIQMRGKLLS